jgi:hypothetical protein
MVLHFLQQCHPPVIPVLQVRVQTCGRNLRPIILTFFSAENFILKCRGNWNFGWKMFSKNFRWKIFSKT